MNESKPKLIQHKVLKNCCMPDVKHLLILQKDLQNNHYHIIKDTTHITKDTCNMFQVDAVASALQSVTLLHYFATRTETPGGKNTVNIALNRISVCVCVCV